MKKVVFYCVLCLLTYGCQIKNEIPKTILLDSNWQFKKIKDSIWNTASVPGNVHADLLQNKLIEDPFISDNVNYQQWVSETDWEYKTNFKVDAKTLQNKHVELNFEGLDTYTSVFLNDRLILKTNNAFRHFKVNVKEQLKEENELRILFEKTSTSEEKEKSKLHYSLPEGNRIFTRKAQFQYGWDWGPKMNTSGIWKPVYLRYWNDFKIENIYVKQKQLDDDSANLLIEIKKRSNVELDKKLTYDIYVNDILQKSSNEIFKGHTWITELKIKNPKRWWPHNLGEPYLYNIKVVVKNGNQILDSISVKKGLRTIELINEKDSLGESFYFKINDVPVYAKGANYIPQNSMQNHVTDTHYEKLLKDVVEANMNMLRVWGGGIYENDIFYNLCDEKGILVWQDFMFACAMYPGDDAFLKNVTLEAEQQVKRLRNHAAIALWCGNNENAEGWHRWGWQANRSEAEKEEIWHNYLKVFDSILPQTVAQFSNIDYWESSPKYGRGNPKYKLEGDAHDWWIWHDAYPFEHLEENVPRFMSEFGFQSYPSYEVVNYINQNDAVDITSEGFQTHQKHSRGFQLIQEYMERDFPVPSKPEDYVYVSQLLQAYGITKGIEAHRRAKPYNMGTLFWQLNDCWPAVSWSSIDYLGNWKALHYKAKRSFVNVLISSEVKNNELQTFVVNDNLERINDTISIQLMDFDGKIIKETSKGFKVDENSSKLIHSLDLNNIPMDKTEVVLVHTFNTKKRISYLAKPKDLKLREQTIQKTVSKTSEGYKIELMSKTLQKDVFLFCNEEGRFSDNYFDLLPNEKRTIIFHSKSKSLIGLKTKTLNSLLTSS